MGQEFFGGNDGYFPDVAFCFLQISPVFFEGKHRDGLKPGHDAEHNDSMTVLNTSGEGYGVTIHLEAS
ncbi:hypothetical protein ECW26_48080 [Escherichia coli W26]|nr:hypothetical protein ECW26_48080 [Escherichia coli W26]